MKKLVALGIFLLLYTCGYSQTIYSQAFQPVNNYWLYRNPASGQFTLNAGNPLEAAITIYLYDETGRILVTDVWQQGATSRNIDADSLSRGFYFIRFSDQWSEHVMKIVK